MAQKVNTLKGGGTPLKRVVKDAAKVPEDTQSASTS